VLVSFMSLLIVFVLFSLPRLNSVPFSLHIPYPFFISSHPLLTPRQQIHKIPGTTYALSPSPHPTSSTSASSLNGWEQEDTEGNETFRAKMERLQDETSTNLYIEGYVFPLPPPFFSSPADRLLVMCRLPLSIDEPVGFPSIYRYPSI
jgi:hypothetical protein